MNESEKLKQYNFLSAVSHLERMPHRWRTTMSSLEEKCKSCTFVGRPLQCKLKLNSVENIFTNKEEKF